MLDTKGMTRSGKLYYMNLFLKTGNITLKRLNIQ